MAYSKKRSSRRRSIRRKVSRRRSSVSRRRSCGAGYVRNRSTGLCVYDTGNKGRKLNKKRAVVRAHKREGRASPNISAVLFPVGKVARGGDGNLWKIIMASNGTKRWVRA